MCAANEKNVVEHKNNAELAHLALFSFSQQQQQQQLAMNKHCLF